eukprot:623596-Rhodomonas_salina.1
MGSHGRCGQGYTARQYRTVHSRRVGVTAGSNAILHSLYQESGCSQLFWRVPSYGRPPFCPPCPTIDACLVPGTHHIQNSNTISKFRIQTQSPAHLVPEKFSLLYLCCI